MSKEEKDRSVVHLRDASDAFIGALRLGDGFDLRMLSDLKVALSKVGVAWKGDSSLPKALVNILLGLSSWINSASYLYGEAEGDRIRSAATEVETLIFRDIVPAEDEFY